MVRKDIQDQGKISLSVMLKYKSSKLSSTHNSRRLQFLDWQNAALQAQRHNK